MKKTGPIVLAILDGWGIAPPNKGNAVALAKTPYFDMYKEKYPYTELRASGKAVGLPSAQDGNSEAGHMNIGAGRVTEQDAVNVQDAIKDGTFFKNAAFLEAIKHVKKNRSKLHVVGLLCDNNSPHAYPPHLYALLDLLEREDFHNIVLHLFTDGRDSYQHAALGMLKELKSKFKNNEKIGTVMGRFYGMERNKRWKITEQAFNALVMGTGEIVEDPEAVIERAYNRGETDEFIKPAVIGKNKEEVEKTRIGDDDAVIFYNLRSDRTRQITKCFVQKDFNKMNPGSFKRRKVAKNLKFVAMTDFGPDLDSIMTAFPSADIEQTLTMTLKDKKQLYIAESEKYAHVTYFFNGGYKGSIAGETRIRIPSPDIPKYDKAPHMSAGEITNYIIKDIRKDSYDFYCVNFANPDMVGHTGNLNAAVEACSFVDMKLGELVSEVKKKNGTVLVTADHGNAEEMINIETGEIDTKHSHNLVPFIVVSDSVKIKLKERELCVLSDIAPTILKLFNIDKPGLMRARGLWM